MNRTPQRIVCLSAEAAGLRSGTGFQPVQFLSKTESTRPARCLSHYKNRRAFTLIKLLVFTAAYHLRRGYCCDSGCRHCPYEAVAHSFTVKP